MLRADVKVVLYEYDSKKLNDGSYPIYIRVTKNRKRKYISLRLSAIPKQWDKDSGSYVQDKRLNKDYKNFNRFIEKKANEARNLIEEFERDNIDFTLNQFADRFLTKSTQVRVEEYFQSHIEKLKKGEHIGNANAYDSTLRILKIYKPKISTLTFNDIDYGFTKGFHEFLATERKVKTNTIKFYMKQLRSIYRQAIDDGVASKDFFPFEKYKISSLKQSTAKRYLPTDHLKKINQATFDKKHLILTQKLFMFSFYSMGMNFIDMGYLQPNNITIKQAPDGTLRKSIVYERRKTHKSYEVVINKDIEELLNFFKSNYPDSGYLLPIITKPEHTGEKLYNHIKNRFKRFNDYLKIISKELDIPFDISSYYARHSFAMTMKNKGISTAIISEALGHETESVTQVYLDSFQNDEVANAAEGLLD